MRQELLSKESAEIRGMFASIAHRYDLLNRVLSVGRDVSWRKTVAQEVGGVRPGCTLDVCTGTGDLALALHGTTVFGADFCLPMLEVARAKALSRRRSVPFFAADALRLPMRDACVDTVTVAFGIRNFANLGSGLKELARVLRPGGMLLVLEFSRPRGALAPLLSWWVRNIPPRVGRLISGDSEAYSYLPASVGTFAEGRELCRILAATGLRDVEERRLTGGVATLYKGTR
ncbi:MAG: ubiquinone/menaquinone biosynthesis methyltransferase [Holophagae bacterium]|jgi:demethylmenaquinone methyltransferase/2-methoxy-6-polyprenyl-1,4-benzoquinol methylase